LPHPKRMVGYKGANNATQHPTESTAAHATKRKQALRYVRPERRAYRFAPDVSPDDASGRCGRMPTERCPIAICKRRNSANSLSLKGWDKMPDCYCDSAFHENGECRSRTGTNSRPMMHCPACCGTGKIVRQWKYGTDIAATGILARCETCNGMGKLSKPYGIGFPQNSRESD
jgi:hypothetical protein